MATKIEVDRMLAEVASGNLDNVPVLEDGIREGVVGAGHLVYVCVERAARVKNGLRTPESRIPNAFAVIDPKAKTIRLVGAERTHGQPGEFLPKGHQGPLRAPLYKGSDKTFSVGDQAEYDSYNLSYYGPITNVTAKTVVVQKGHTSRDGKANLDLASFFTKNHDFDLSKARERNANWSD